MVDMNMKRFLYKMRETAEECGRVFAEGHRTGSGLI